MDELANLFIHIHDSDSIVSYLFITLLFFYALIRMCVFLAPKIYHLFESYRKKKNTLDEKDTQLHHFPKQLEEINAKIDKLSASLESFIDYSNGRDEELSGKIDILFSKQEEIRKQQNEDKADNIRESILNFAERLRNNPDGEYSIEKFNQIFASGSKYKKIIEENELTNDVFVHDYEFIESQYDKRFNKL